MPAREGAPGELPVGESALPDRPIDRLLAVMRRLRGPGGCPWDREQTLASLKAYLVEECYETLDAIDGGEPDRIREELGDVLLQIVFQARICEEEGWFGFEDVAATLAEKLIRRHPHVFGDVRVSGPAEVLRNWESIKDAERGGETGRGSAVDGIPPNLPALHQADRVQARAARVGFDWPDTDPVLAKLDEEVAELKAAVAGGAPARIREEIGDVLFTVVNLTRFLHVNAEQALRGTTAKFIRRFREVERRMRAAGRPLADCTLRELDAAWDAVKAEEASPSDPPPRETP